MYKFVLNNRCQTAVCERETSDSCKITNQLFKPELLIRSFHWYLLNVASRVLEMSACLGSKNINISYS